MHRSNGKGFVDTALQPSASWSDSLQLEGDQGRVREGTVDEGHVKYSPTPEVIRIRAGMEEVTRVLVRLANLPQQVHPLLFLNTVGGLDEQGSILFDYLGKDDR